MRGASHRESDDSYRAIVAVLNEHWRVISCPAGIQWILQHVKFRRGVRSWEGRSYCRTREALHRLAGPIDDHARTILDALPGRIEEGPSQ